MTSNARRIVAFALGVSTMVVMSGFLLTAAQPQEVGTWGVTGTTDPSSARVGAATATLADGSTFIAGGKLGDGTVTDSVVVYDPLSNASTTVGHLLSPRVNAAAARLDDGRVLVVGGEVGELLTADVEIFDPSAGTSIIAGAMAQPRTQHAAARLADGRVLIVGGATVDGVALASTEVFDPETFGMLPAASMAVARVGATTTLLIDNRVLVAGGNSGPGTPDLASAELYHPFSNEFVPVDTQLSVARSGHTATLLPHNGAVLVAGGTAAGVPVTDVDLFLPAMFPDPYSWGMGSFAPAERLAGARAHAVAGPSGDDGYAFVVGGGVPVGEAYAFTTIKTDKDDYAPGELALITGSGWEPGEMVTLTFQEDPAVHDDYVLEVVADGEGNIRLDTWAPEAHDANVRFYLMATGSHSQSKLQVTFTDSVSFQLSSPAENSEVPYATTAGAIDLVVSGTYVCNDSGSTDCYSARVTVSIRADDGTNNTFTGSSVVTNHSAGTLPATDNSADPWSTTLQFRTVAGPGQYTIPGDGLYEIQATMLRDSDNDGDYESPVILLNDKAFRIDNAAPTNVHLSSPADNSFAQCTGNTTLSATASDNLAVTKVEFYVNGALKGTDSNAGGGWSVNLTSADFVAANTWYAIAYDAANNQTTSAETWNIGLDCSRPTVTVNQAAGQGDPTSVSPIHFTVTFSEDVTGFATGDVALGGTAGATTAIVTPDPADPSRVYDVAISGMTMSGLVTASVNANRASDAAGNGNFASTSSDNQVTYATDSSAPVITPNIVGTLGTNDWYTSSVSLSWTVTDSESTVTSTTGCDPSDVTSDTAGQTFTCSATSAGGTNSVSVTIKVDRTAPTASASALPAPNGNGWNNTNVTVSFSGSDGLSGIASCDAAVVLSSEGSGQSASGTCTDNAGNVSALATASGINIDKTAPTASASASPAANAHGWNNTDVTVSFSGNEDDLSGIAFCDAPVVLSSEGAGQSASGTCTDKAGNVSTSATASGINIDKTAPINVSGAPNRSPDHNGWYNHALDVVFTGTDALSGIASCTTANYSGPDGNNVTVNGSCTDKAGNSSGDVASSAFDYDSTAPTISASLSPSPAPSGWYNIATGAPTVSFTCSDATSGLDGACPSPQAFGEGADQSKSETIYDVAGNSATAGVTNVDVDLTAPSIVATLSPASPAASGWYNIATGAPTVSFTCSDALSGPAGSCPSASTFGEGENQSRSETIYDVAGNSATAGVSNIDVDLTVPSVSITSPVNGSNHVLNAAVSSDYACSDGTSGVATCAGPVADGANFDTASVGSKSFVVNATDNAGNSNSASASYSVQYASGGLCLGSPGHTILQPINPDGNSVFKQKSTVPAKFRVCDANGVSIGTPGVVSNFKLYQVINGTVTDTVNEPVDSTAADSNFRWSATDQQWIFNINTKSLSAGKTYVFLITLNDGSPIEFRFGLK